MLITIILLIFEWVNKCMFLYFYLIFFRSLLICKEIYQNMKNMNNTPGFVIKSTISDPNPNEEDDPTSKLNT